MDELFISTKIKSSVSVEPKDLNNNLNRKIVSKIRNDVEGKCIKNGYVKKNSVRLVKRSLGESLTSQFNGCTIFHIEYLVDLCNPLEGASITCEVLNINKMGVLAGIDDADAPLNILLAKQHHIENAEFEDLKVGDSINIKVLGKKYEFGDSQISIIGLLENEYIKQNQMLEEDDDDEDIEQLSNDASIDSLSFQSSQQENNISIPESMPSLLSENNLELQEEDLGEIQEGNANDSKKAEGLEDDEDLDEITLKPVSL